MKVAIIGSKLGKPVEEWRFRPDGSYGPGVG